MQNRVVMEPVPILCADTHAQDYGDFHTSQSFGAAGSPRACCWAQNPVRYSRVGLGSTMRFRGRLLLIWCRAGTEAWLAPAAVMCEQERGTQSAVSQARVVDLCQWLL